MFAEQRAAPRAAIRRRNRSRRARFLLGLCCLAGLAAAPAAGDGRADSQAGAFCGQVLDLVSAKPVADATVAVQDKGGKVIAWTKTDGQGRYSVAADTLAALDLRPTRHRGLLADIGRGIVQVVSVPVKAAGAVVDTATDVVKETDPVGTAKSAAASMAVSSPAPLESKAAQDVGNVVTDKAQSQARQSAVNAVTGQGPPAPRKGQDALTPGPGEVRLTVSAPDHTEFAGKAGAYWLEAAEPAEAGKTAPTRAWLETVELAPAGSDKKSQIQEMAVRLAEPSLNPALAPAGSTVRISARLQAPGEPAVKVRVLAREARTHQVVELTPQGNGVFAGGLTLDAKSPPGDTTVTVAAFHAQPVAVELRPGKVDPLLDFAAHLDALDPDKPYRFDPRIMASENRLDLKMTILDPKQKTPPAPPSAPAAPDGKAAPASPHTPGQ